MNASTTTWAFQRDDAGTFVPVPEFANPRTRERIKAQNLKLWESEADLLPGRCRLCDYPIAETKVQGMGKPLLCCVCIDLISAMAHNPRFVQWETEAQMRRMAMGLSAGESQMPPTRGWPDVDMPTARRNEEMDTCDRCFQPTAFNHLLECEGCDRLMCKPCFNTHNCRKQNMGL